MSAQAALLPGGRQHLNHGPIDLIIEATPGGTEGMAGPIASRRGQDVVQEAYRRAMERFDGMLEGLVEELPALRGDGAGVTGPVAQAMVAAVAPFRPRFITPMAAVAGAVADAVLAAVAGPGIARAYVNNGGDIALYLTPGESLTAAVAARTGMPDRVAVSYGDPVRGVATSGWRGRSQSLGIADAVTVLARSAAAADAAATMIGNAVDLPGHPGIGRRPARELKADSDLGERLVTVSVARLGGAEVAAALGRGAACAEALRGRGLIAGAALFLQGRVRVVGQGAGTALAAEEVSHG
jgi:ApbE superfamily uncharacterized protein (UPF0280 family)